MSKEMEGFMVIPVPDKLSYYKKNALKDIRFNEKVRCMKCRKEFILNEFKVVKRDEGGEFIVCKYFPECDGTLMDFMHALPA
ncbi:MAG: hypothetical protein FWG92_03075 [Leptospirales bacterium]|nr:hypothetical protein [Leptospirales bacterium]